MTKVAFINDVFVEEEKAFLHFRDLSIQRGYGVFDFFRLLENEPLFLEDHLNRFYASAEGLHLPVPFSHTQIENIIRELIGRNNLPGTGMRLQLTGGYSPDGFTLANPNFIISQHSFSAPVRVKVNTGIKLHLHPYQRQLPGIKTIDYLMAVWLQPLLTAKSFDDALYHNGGYITECPRSNFFLVTKDDVLITPVENILAGITRKNVLKLAERVFTVEERAIHLDEIKTAKEAFISSTTKQILPVMQIDETVLPRRKMTMELLQLFQSTYKY